MKTIGPKSYRSKLPMGKVDDVVVNMIAVAEAGKMSDGVFTFDIHTRSGVRRGAILKWEVSYKKYNLFDKIAYATCRLLVK